MKTKICQMIALVLCLFLSMPRSYGGGDLVGNGGGIGEQNTALAWQALPRLLKECVSQTGPCRVNDSLFELSRILSTDTTTFTEPSALIFRSAYEFPDLFPIDPAYIHEKTPPPRARYTTERKVGAPIIVNLDRLTEVDNSIVTYVASIGDAVEFLIQAMTYQHELEQDPSIGSLVKTLRERLDSSVTTARAITQGYPELLISSINPSPNNLEMEASLILNDSHQLVDFGKLLMEGPFCPASSKLSLRSIKDLFWEPIFTKSSDQHLQSFQAYVQGRSIWSCESAESGKTAYQGQIALDLLFNLDSNHEPAFQRGSEKLSIFEIRKLP